MTFFRQILHIGLFRKRVQNECKNPSKSHHFGRHVDTWKCPKRCSKNSPKKVAKITSGRGEGLMVYLPQNSLTIGPGPHRSSQGAPRHKKSRKMLTGAGYTAPLMLTTFPRRTYLGEVLGEARAMYPTHRPTKHRQRTQTGPAECAERLNKYLK